MIAKCIVGTPTSATVWQAQTTISGSEKQYFKICTANCKNSKLLNMHHFYRVNI